MARLPPWWLIERASRAATGDSPAGGPVTFPTTDLALRARLGVGQSHAEPADLAADPESWNWVDISDYVRQDLGVATQAGRRGGSDLVTPGSMTLKLDNSARPGTAYPAAGRFTRRNPHSPLLGLLTNNTPIWVEVDPGSGWRTVARMHVNEWPTRWADKSATDSTVTVTCSGAMARLQQAAVSGSALRRAILATGPVAYWPLEDGSGAATAGSGLPGGSAMDRDGDPGLGADGPAGSDAAVDLSDGGRLTVRLPGLSATAWCVLAVVKATVGSSTESVLALRMSPGSAWVEVALTDQVASSGFGVSGERSSGTVDAANAAQVDEAEWHVVALVGSESGGVARVDLYVDDELGVTSYIDQAGSIGAPLVVSLNRNLPGLAHVDLPGQVCHLAVYSGATAAPALAAAVDGHQGESATARITRLCAEAGVSLAYGGQADAGPAMGPQSAGALMDLLRECEAVDGGSLHEDGWGLGYLCRHDRENRPVDLRLDFDLGHVAELPQPADDNRHLRNRWTVSRPSGSEHTHELATGPLGTGPGGPGVWPDATSANVETDALLAWQSSWRVWRDTVDEDRWPSVAVNLARSADLVDQLRGLPHGARVTLANPPAEMPPDTVDATVEGVAQRFDARSWRAWLNTFPNAPNHCFRLAESTGDADEWVGYLVPDSWSLAAAVDEVEVSLACAVDPPLSTDADDWAPGARIKIGGELMLLTAVSGSSSPQTLTVTRSVNGVTKSHLSEAPVEFASPGALGP